MLKIFHTPKELNKAQLMTVYEQSNRDEGKQRYPYLPENLQILRAEEDFCAYVDVFLKDERSIYAIWTSDDVYCAALRIEAYRDGYLLSGLETALTARRKGYATELVKEFQNYLKKFGAYKLYSHVSKTNRASMIVHMNCGFVRVLDHAVYVDGSVFHNVYTLCYEG